ncbi:hypothetical protein ABPG73_008921 [Tetrahymena malaccensis]
MKFLFLQVILLCTILLDITRSQHVNDCLQKGYLDCLDKEGNCTQEKSKCSNPCSSNDDCINSCCLGGFCFVSNQCQTNIDHKAKQAQNKSRIQVFGEHILSLLIGIAIISPIVCISLCKFKKLVKIENVQIENEIQETEMPINQNISFKPYNMWQKTEPDYQHNQHQDSIFMQENIKQQELFSVKSNQNNQEKQISISQLNTTIFQSDYEKQQSVSASFIKLNQLQNKSEKQ